MSFHNTEKSDNSQSNQAQKDSIVMFWKQPGETLAVMLRRFREEQGITADEKLTYAGRLDPMAEGIVPILVGGARFQKEHLNARSKTYEVSIALGISTDTGDMLGLALPAVATSEGGAGIALPLKKEIIEKTINTLSTIKELPYPHYSSRPVDGKPLFVHARAGNKVALPIKKVTIYSMELVSIEEMSICALLSSAQKIIAMVQGDFRQQEIIEQWQKMIEVDGDRSIQIVTIRTTVSSGTYMRSLAEKMGELLGVPALACRIARTAIV